MEGLHIGYQEEKTHHRRNFDQHVHDVWRLGINGDDYKK